MKLGSLSLNPNQSYLVGRDRKKPTHHGIWGQPLVSREPPFLHLHPHLWVTKSSDDSSYSEECWEVWIHSVCERTFPTVPQSLRSHDNGNWPLLRAYLRLASQAATHSPSTLGFPDSTLGPHQSPSEVSYTKSLLPSWPHSFSSHTQGNTDSSRLHVTWPLASILTQSLILLPSTRYIAVTSAPLLSWDIPVLCHLVPAGSAHRLG